MLAIGEPLAGHAFVGCAENGIRLWADALSCGLGTHLMYALTAMLKR